MEWKYKIDLEDESVFSEIENVRNIKFPEELKQLILEGNAATPDKYLFMLGADEKVVGAVLSFNKNDKDVDSVYTALDIIEETNVLPFAIDPFGNYICINCETNEVVYWEHETRKITTIAETVQEFVGSLF